MILNFEQLVLLASACFLVGAASGLFATLNFKLHGFTSPIQSILHLWPFKLTKAFSTNDKSPVKVITTNEEFDQIYPRLLQDLSQIKLLGFDCEWTSTKKKKMPVALLQLATASGLCLLIRSNCFNGCFSESLLGLLKDKNILKVGVGCVDDAKKLLVDHGMIVNGCVDLRFMVGKDSSNDNLKTNGLKNLASFYLNTKLNKSHAVRCSNWDVAVLTDEQIRYAAADALIGLGVFSKLVQNHLENNKEKTSSFFDDAMLAALWRFAYQHCQDCIDVQYKEKSRNNVKNNSKKQQRKLPNLSKAAKSYSVRKQVLYDNCKIEAPDGQLLSTCDKKKAWWYINKTLADLVSEEPITVRLRFEPAGRSSADEDYYLTDKENVCVVCGSTGSIVRKNIVPQEYRRHFPLVMKDHSSHDIVPLCVPCHQRSGYFDNHLRNELAQLYEAPLGSAQAVQLLEDPGRRRVRSAGRALVSAGPKIPTQRRTELEDTLRQYYEVDEVTNELLMEASNLETRFKNEAYVPHGEKVVHAASYQDNIKGIVSFERKWREHFMEKMQPKHMPTGWSITHNHAKILNVES